MNRRRSQALPTRIGLVAAAIASLALSCTPGIAASPLPARDGVYCGPNQQTITVDSVHNDVDIAGYTCDYPIIAADKLQSAECHNPGMKPDYREFDFRLLNNAILHNNRWYVLCRPLPKS